MGIINHSRKYIIEKHPLLHETPELWKNIPIPVRDAFRNVIQVFIASDESGFDYQMKTNERLFKLQTQINNMKLKNEKAQLILSGETDTKLYEQE